MGVLLGSAAAYSTWGKFRTPIGKGYPSDPESTVTFNGSYSVYYNLGFKSADAWLLRKDPFYDGVDALPPKFVYVSIHPGGTPPADPFGEFYLSSGHGFFPHVNGLPQEELLYLAGQLVTMTAGGSFTLSTDAWTTPPGLQTVAADMGELAGIGGFAPFSP